MELANTDTSQLDDNIIVVGYPSLENESVVNVQGTITGFIAETSGGDKSWIKTNSVISGTMSGGGAYNLNGNLIGIPTSAPVSFGLTNPECKRLDDTNQDGIINSEDRCVPIGDFTNAIRPSKFARPLIKSARLQIDLTPLSSQPKSTQQNQRPQFSRLFFAPSIDNQYPTTVVGSLPGGTNSLYLFFDYKNMTPQTVYELRVEIDGIPNQTFSLSPVRWSGGENGLWYIGSTGQRWANGEYEFKLFIDGNLESTARITIGGPPVEQAQFSNISFGLLDSSGNLAGNGFVLPTGNIINARFIYQNMSDGTNWSAVWYANGEPIRNDFVWSAGENGSLTTNLEVVGGLIPGSYRLELYLENNGNLRLSATADFVVAGAQEGIFPAVFRNIRFIRAETIEKAASTSSSASYPDGAKRLFNFFDWQQLAPGTNWTMEWLIDNEVFYSSTQPWRLDETGTDYINELHTRDNSSSLPDGTYTFNLYINGFQLVSETVVVGIGQLPIDRFAQASGIQLQGQIIDAETGLGIENATFILISEKYSIEEFVWNSEQIYALAITDSEGNFLVDRPLQPDKPYSVMISVDNYLPMTADGFILKLSDNNPTTMLIPLTRD
ncbi:hypothetical protein MASR2M15_02580 [Anaerolineales bacterium]